MYLDFTANEIENFPSQIINFRGLASFKLFYDQGEEGDHKAGINNLLSDPNLILIADDFCLQTNMFSYQWRK